MTVSASAQDLQAQLARLTPLREAIGQAIVGQHDVVEQLLIGLLAGGHCLLEGVPGLGKTLLVRSLGEALHLQFRRVQFTPDLMPSDILGTELLEEDHGTGHRHFRFQPGPIFTNLLLADELNRTPPKTQAALLEAMQERTVSYAGTTHALPSPMRSPAVASRKLNWPMNTWSASSSPASPSMQVLGAMRVSGSACPARPCSPNTMRKKSCRQSQRRQRLSSGLMGKVAPESKGPEIVEEVRRHRRRDAPGRSR